MAKIKIRIESERTTDIYARYHGKSIDEPLKDDWWTSQPEKKITMTSEPEENIIKVHEETVDLTTGKHYVEYATSGYVPNYAWHAKIIVNDRVVGEGDVGRHTHLRVNFLVGLLWAWPIPSPFLPARIYLMPIKL